MCAAAPVGLRGENDNNAPPADFSPAGIGPGQGKAGRHRGIARVPAAPQHIGTQSCGYLLLSNDHAVFGDHGMNGVAGRRRVKAAALLLRGGRHAISDDQQDCRQYPAPLCKEGHLNSAAGLVEIRRAVAAPNAICVLLQQAKRLLVIVIWQDISSIAVVTSDTPIAAVHQTFPPRSPVIPWSFFVLAAEPSFSLITTFPS